MSNRKHTLGIAIAVVAVTATGIAIAAGGKGFAKGFLFRHLYEGVKKEMGLSPQQSKRVDALRDRIRAHFRAQHGDRKALLGEARGLWLSASLDAGKVDALAAKIHAKREATHRLIRGAILELHQILTPAQRGTLLGLIEAFKGRMKGWHKHGGF